MGGFGASGVVARGAGERVTLVDQFEPGDASSSGGETRLYRCAHGPDAGLHAMARRARTLWRELEEESGEELLDRCGLAWFAHREDGWEAESERTLAAQGIPPSASTSRAPAASTRAFAATTSLSSCSSRRAACSRQRAVRALAAQAVVHGAQIVRGRARPDGAAAVSTTRRGWMETRRVGVRPVAGQVFPRSSGLALGDAAGAALPRRRSRLARARSARLV